MSVGILLIVAAVVWLLYHYQKASKRLSRKGARRKSAPVAVRKAQAEQFTWPQENAFEFEIVGEASYQGALKRLAGDHDDRYGANVEYLAELVPENDNEYDDKAMQVLINDQTVGYMSRADARSFRRRLGHKGLTNQVTSCMAVIAGGGLEDGRRFKYGVRLDIKPFE